MSYLGLILVFFLSVNTSTYAQECTYSIPLPLEKISHSYLGNMTRDSLLLMLTALSRPKELRDNSVTFDCSTVFPEAHSTFKSLSKETSYLSVFSRLRNFLKYGAYHRAQAINHNGFSLPKSVKQLEEQLQFKSWPSETVAWSQVKGKRRILYRSPSGFPSMSIAQTEEEDDSIRETEIILKREDLSGNYDFYAYGSDGLPTFRSPFMSGSQKETIGPVPYTCMTCHYDGRRRVFQTLPSSFHPH